METPSTEAPSVTLVFIFRVNADGTQVVVYREVLSGDVSHEEFLSWFKAHQPEDCGTYQGDVVNFSSVVAAFPPNQYEYAGSQWVSWQALKEGDVVTDSLAGTYDNAHVTVEDCKVDTPVPPVPTDGLTTQAVIIPPPLAPLPTIPESTTTTTAQPTPVSEPVQPHLATTGVGPAPAIIVACGLMILGQRVMRLSRRFT